MPTKTHRRTPAQKVRPYQPGETELFPRAICGEMARALGVDAPDDITRLHGILNDSDYAQLTAWGEKFGIPPAGQRATLKELQKSLEKPLRLIEQLDWQSNEDIAAAYARERNVFTASANSTGVEFYNQRNAATRLTEALATFRAALEELTHDRAPLDWAATQHGLGNVLVRLGEREVGAARLTEAVAAYQAALQERKRDERPVDWAMTTGNQGIALMLLAQRLGDADRARLAVQQIEIASVTMRDHENAALAADYNRQALKARTLLRQLTTR